MAIKAVKKLSRRMVLCSYLSSDVKMDEFCMAVDLCDLRRVGGEVPKRIVVGDGMGRALAICMARARSSYEIVHSCGKDA